MEQIAGGVDQSDGLFPRENDGQSTWRPGIRDLFDRVHSFQRFAEEETQRRRMQADGANAQFALLEQVHLIGTKVFFAQFIRRTMEVLGEVLHDFQVGVYGSLRVITTLEL